MTDRPDLPARLADALAEKGALRDPAWAAALRAVPRHRFVPRYLDQQPDGTWRTVDGADPATRRTWLDAVYSDRVLTTALRPLGDGQRVPASSSSEPGLMIRMLETLDLRDGHRVLEVGTGTGFNAGLLCHRLGAGHVTSIDLEPDLVAAAAIRLAELGFAPRLAVADGIDGLPAGAPYDRVVATCSVDHVPPAWIAQLAPDGRILTDLKITGAAGNLVDLRRTPDGVEGRFLPRWAGFMPLRTAGPAPPRAPRRPRAVQRTTTLPAALPWREDPVVWFLAALHLPAGIDAGFRVVPGTGTPAAAMLEAADGSWTEVTRDGRTVTGSAPDLWAAVEDADRLWHDLGEPGWERLGVTADATGQRVWVDAPTRTVGHLRPAPTPGPGRGRPRTSAGAG